MANQQAKRRRKRYQAGSAYAGDVKPSGVLGFLGSSKTMIVIFGIMALALAGGGIAGLLTQTFGNSNDQQNQAGFVEPDDNEDGTPAPDTTPSFKQYDAPPAMTIDASKTYTATIQTELGDIEVELTPGSAPETVNNFVFLANDGFYNGLVFHYVQQGFEAIAGDPTCTALGEDCRGSGGPGYELSEQVAGEYVEGTLGMVNGSQFFIAFTGSDQFADFTPFGRVTSGLNIAEQLTQGTKIEGVTVSES
jgi:peptidyl-prolyl cis-trans isomerase B (cyclophilin B)